LYVFLLLVAFAVILLALVVFLGIKLKKGSVNDSIDAYKEGDSHRASLKG
jgi:hypothetical protein